MSNLFPVLVVSRREENMITCGRGCNCYHGSVPADCQMKSCQTPEELIEHITQLDYSTFLYWQEYPYYRDRNEYGHFILSLRPDDPENPINIDINCLSEGIEFQWQIDQDFPWLKEAVAKRLDQLTAGAKAKQEAEKLKKEEEERQRQVLAQMEREKTERKEYERLKSKFETQSK